MPEFSADTLRTELPELPWVKRDRYKNFYKLTDKEIAVLVDSPVFATYFESVISNFASDEKKVKLTVNYFLTDYLGMLKKEVAGSGANIDAVESTVSRISPALFAELISMIAAGDLSSRGAKDIITMMTSDSAAATTSPKELAKKHGLIQSNDASAIIPAIEKIIADNAAVVAEYKAGKTASLQFLIGQAMKVTKGAANPEIIRKTLLEKLA